MDSSQTDHDPAERGWILQRRWLVLIVVATVVLVADQLTKWWALEALDDGPVEVIWTLRFNLVFNQASAFSIGGGARWGPFVSILAVGVLVYLVWQIRRAPSPLSVLAVGLVVGGAIGNLVDRAFRRAVTGDGGLMGGAVVDFIDLQWWPVFNIADMAVVVGAFAFVFSALAHDDDDAEVDAQSPDAADPSQEP